ncbi:hypothetical protein GOV14_03550 [Candidatus Pacearchaeota archaeon]|nr:hypothetical protein [Candidatus Pacearchaeota archaeon]
MQKKYILIIVGVLIIGGYFWFSSYMQKELDKEMESFFETKHGVYEN